MVKLAPLLIVFLAFGCASLRPVKLPPWSDAMSDGCSFPGGEPGWVTPAEHFCCVRHDERYYYGGTIEDRARADAELTGCIARVSGDPLLAAIFYIGVAVGGGPEYRVAPRETFFNPVSGGGSSN